MCPVLCSDSPNNNTSATPHPNMEGRLSQLELLQHPSNVLFFDILRVESPWQIFSYISVTFTWIQNLIRTYKAPIFIFATHICHKCSTFPPPPGFRVRASVSQHQGGRAYMEDFSSVTVDADNQEACFAVYDGHGGHDAAYFCQRNLWHNIR